MADNTISIDIAKMAIELEADLIDPTMFVATIAGVANKFRVKHSAIGSGFVFKGDFAAVWELGMDAKFVQASTLILPIDIGNKIAKQVKGTKRGVKFKVHIFAKKSELLLQGYAFALTWDYEPAEMGQLSIGLEMLKPID